MGFIVMRPAGNNTLYDMYQDGDHTIVNDGILTVKAAGPNGRVLAVYTPGSWSQAFRDGSSLTYNVAEAATFGPMTIAELKTKTPDQGD